MRRRKDGQRARELAMQRMERLFLLAEEEHEAHPERSDRYVQIARRISTRVRVRMPGHFKSLYCRQCGRYLPPSAVRVRVREGMIVATCLYCGRQRRRPCRMA